VSNYASGSHLPATVGRRYSGGDADTQINCCY